MNFKKIVEYIVVIIAKNLSGRGLQGDTCKICYMSQ